jgi:pSer/pThr/pTyr-binding forkhead associated (FHA) protein
MRDYLAAKPYVSRGHATLTMVNDDVYIQNISETNRTFVNNTPIPHDASVLLKNGDKIGLGGKVLEGKRRNNAAYFVFEVSG